MFNIIEFMLLAGLSGGAIAGIVIGSVAGTAAIAGGTTIAVIKVKGSKTTKIQVKPTDDIDLNEDIEANYGAQS